MPRRPAAAAPAPSLPLVLEQDYELVAVDRLEPHPANPRRGKVAVISGSVKANGFYGAVVAQKSTGHVLVGNHRFLSLREAGAAEVPCIWVDVDDAHARRILAVDNRSSDVAEYDEAELADLLSVIHGEGGLEGTGFGAAELAALLKTNTPESRTDPDDAPAKPTKKAIVAPGDVWVLGPHRLVCGDGTDGETVALALGSAGQADMLFTDPPYGVDYEGGTADKLKIANDALSAADLEDQLLAPAFARAFEVLRPGGVFYICSPSGALETSFRSALTRARLELRQQIVWVKNRFVLGHSDFHMQHETILYGWQLAGEPPVPPHFDPEHDTMLYGWKEGAKHRWEGGRRQSSVWAYDKPAKSELHPTMKPVQLVKRAVTNSTGSGGHVLDLFGGSGTTVIACHLAGRIAHVVELDPRYCDVIARRYQEHTGIVPVNEKTGRARDFTGGDQ